MRTTAIAVAALLFAGAPAVAAGTVRVKNLKVLAVIYRGAEDDAARMDERAVAKARAGLELGREFYFRNSRARLNVALDWRIIDTAAPDNAGPTMEHMVADLRRRGVQDGDYDGLIVTGVGLTGNWGGFNVLGGAGGCFGIGGDRGPGYPGFDPEIGYGWAWIFVHEFQHALDLVIADGSNLRMLHAHPYADRTEPFFKGCYRGGEHWDWVALTLREFDDYGALRGVRNEFLECADADGDSLPDDDPRLPIDERRFGSDPALKDTDGDGLDDLGELTANIYAASDPRKADTDGDGLADGADPYPLVALRPTLPYRGATGPADPPLLDSVFVRNDPGGAAPVYATWDEDGLYFDFHGPRPFAVHLKIDGSAANGFWEGGDTYLLRIADGQVTFSGPGLSGDVPGATARARTERDRTVLSATIPSRIGQGVSKEINYGGQRDPQDVTDGLTLVPGRAIGLNILYEFTDRTQAVLTPHHTMFATRLVKPADAPLRPVLRGPGATRAAVPVVEVLGVRPLTRVAVGDHGAASASAANPGYGQRIGPGPVHLVRLDRDGPVSLAAWASDEHAGPPARSNTLELLVDRTAAPPRLARAGSDIVAECEPDAELELWWGLDGLPVAPLGGARADATGRAAAALPDANLAGWVVAGFEGSRFERQVFVESWPSIDRVFRAGRPDPRLPPDNFSYRFEGLLVVDTAGPHTFELESDDGARLYVGGELAVDHWGHHGLSVRRGTVHLESGLHPLRIDYYEEDGWAGVKFRAAPPGAAPSAEVPVRRAPVSRGEIELFGVQIDRLGNRSGFGPPLKPGA